MAPALTHTPNPVPSAATASVAGTGFAARMTQLRLDGQVQGDSFKPARGGSFRVGIVVKTTDTATMQTLTAHQRLKGNDPWVQVASRAVAVAAGVVTPEPPPPVTPLTISDVVVAVSQTGAGWKWHVSEKATGQVAYGKTTAYGSTTTLEPSFTYQDHEQSVTGLEAGTTYHYQITSRDAAGRVAQTADATLLTLPSATIPPPDPIPPQPPGSGVQLPPSLVQMSRLQSDPADGPDMTAALLQFFGTVPGGTTILFDPTRKYRVEGELRVPTKTGFRADGQGRAKDKGAFLYRTVQNGDPNASLFRFLQGCSDTQVLGFVIDLKANNPGVYQPNFEWQHAVDYIGGGSNHEAAWLTARNCKGDGVYWAGGANSPARNVKFHDSWLTGICRCAAAAVSVVGALVERVYVHDHGMQVWDMEPNSQDQWVDGVVVQDTVLTGHNAYWFSINGDGDVKNITMQRNRSETQWGLHTYIHQSYGQQMGRRRVNVKVLDNVATQAGPGPTGAKMYFQYVDGLTVTGNKQPLQPGQPLVELDGCTAAVTSPNP